jgi:hypothetical protein
MNLPAESRFRSLLACSVLLLGAASGARAAETSLRLFVPTDSVGGTREVFLTPADGTFTSRTVNRGIAISFSNASFTTRWDLAFVAPLGWPLGPGSYYDAGSFPFQAEDQSGIAVSGTQYSPCSTMTGSFEVKQAEISGSESIIFWALFEARCANAPPIRGEIRVQADAAVAVTAPLDLTVDHAESLAFNVTAADETGAPLALTATGLPPGASFHDLGNSRGSLFWPTEFNPAGSYLVTFQAENEVGTFDRTTTRILLRGARSLRLEGEPGDFILGGEARFYTSRDGEFFPGIVAADRVELRFSAPALFDEWSLMFAAPSGTTLGVGTYSNAVKYGLQAPSQPGLSVSGEGRACSSLTGSFEIKQIGFTSRGGLDSLWATFEQFCGGTAAALRGEVRYHALVPLLLRAPRNLSVPAGAPRSFAVRGYDAVGSPLRLSASAVPDGATFMDRGDGSGFFEWTPGLSQVGRHTVHFTALNDLGDSDIVHTQIEVTLANDDFDAAMAIDPLPFRFSAPNTSSVSADPDDPVCLSRAAQTLWFKLTPASDAPILADSFGTYLGATISVYTGVRGSLRQLACAHDKVQFGAVAGETYYFMVGFSSSIPLTFSVDAAPPPPPNDDFDQARVISALPFSETLDTRTQTAAADDPICAPVAGPVGSVWYSFTPSENLRVAVDAQGSTYSTLVSVYTGARGALTEVACNFYGAGFPAVAGQTYFIMIGSPFGNPGGTLVLNLSGQPPLSLEASIDPVGAARRRTGTAAIRGAVTCSRPAQIALTVTLSQEKGISYSFGSIDLEVACSGTVGWEAAVTSDWDPFSAGPATAAIEAVGTAADGERAFTYSSADVQLQGSLRGRTVRDPSGATGGD